MNINKTAIVVLTYNNLEYNKNCLASIKKYTKPGTYELIVVDNNSTDGTREWLKEQIGIKLVLNNENVGFPKGCNIGINNAESNSDILLLNNDTVVTPRWLENLQRCLYSDPKIGAVGPMCNQFANQQGVDTSYGENLEEMIEFANSFNVSDSNKWEEKNFLIGFCKLIKREVLDKIGLLDERYSPGYVEDNDLSISIINEGYKLILCHDTYIHHYLGKAFRKDWNKFWELVLNNREKFNKKWGFHTDRFEDIRFDLISLIDEVDKQKELRILDINASVGGSLLKIKSDYPNSKLYAIEDSESIKRIIKNFTIVSSKKVGEFPLDFEEESFDYIIINNLIENIENPEMFLTEIRKYLKTNGYLIASAKNIMHFTVLRNVLNCNWRYAEGDTLDRTSRNYFTSNDINNLALKCGYQQPYIFYWFTETNEEDRVFIEKLCQSIGQDLGYQFSTRQFSIRLQKNSGYIV